MIDLRLTFAMLGAFAALVLPTAARAAAPPSPGLTSSGPAVSGSAAS